MPDLNSPSNSNSFMRRKEGLTIPLSIAVTIVLLSLTIGAMADTVVSRAELKLCASLATPHLKLSCYESIAAIKPDEPNPSSDIADPGTTSSSVDDFGDEHLDQTDREPKSVVATVTDVRRESGFNGVLYFHLSNGQVWRQATPGYFFFPRDQNTGFDVKISRGVMGDYQLRVDGSGPMTRIKRVK